MIRFWKRLIKLENNRLTKSVLIWDYSTRNKSSNIEPIFENTNLDNIFNDKSLCDMSFFIYVNKWYQLVLI